LLRPLALPSFRLLFASTSVSSVGTLLAAVALAIDVKDHAGRHPGPWVAALTIVEFLPTIAIGFALGPLLDRLSRRALMVGADLARAAVFCALPFTSSAGAIVGLAAVAGVANGFFRPAAYAGLPNLVPDDELAAANGLLQGVENVSWAIGPLLGGILTAAWGPHVAYWINAVSFVLSGALVARIPHRLLQSATALTRGWWQDVGDGWRAVRASRELRAVLVAWTLAMAALGAVNVGEIFLAKNSFHAGDFGYGLLYGAIGIGLVFGSLAAGALVDRFGIGRLYGLAIAWMAACFAGAAASPNVWVGAALALLGGVGNGVAVLCNILLVQRGAGDAVRGRALTVVMGVNYVMLGVASAVAGPVVDAVGARWLWAGAAAILLVAALAGAVMTRGVGDAAEHLPADLHVEPELEARLAAGTAPPGI
jgi:MFS family permease